MSQIVRGIPNEELGDQIEWEGAEYFFLDYINPSRINDAELREGVERFKTAFADIRGRLAALGVEI